MITSESLWLMSVAVSSATLDRKNDSLDRKIYRKSDKDKNGVVIDSSVKYFLVLEAEHAPH